MDWLTFIAELVKAIAWPVEIVLAVFILRGPLLSLLRELKRFKWKDVELEFEKEVQQIKAQLPSPPTHPSGARPYDDEAQLLDLVEISPKVAVLDVWIQVERELFALIKRRNIELPTLSLANC